MLATLRRQQDRAMIPRLLGDDVQVGNKTGTDEEKQPGPSGRKGQVRADAAIVTGPNGLRYAIAIYARQIEDPRSTIENDALTTGARISEMVYEHFAKRQVGRPDRGGRPGSPKTVRPARLRASGATAYGRDRRRTRSGCRRCR